MPSALGFVSWKLKSVVKLWMLVKVLKKVVLASLPPPSVSRKRVPLMIDFPFNVSPEAVKPEP